MTPGWKPKYEQLPAPISDFRCKNTKNSIPNNERRKKMKKILQNIGHGIIVALVTPAAIIHIAYRHWYFKRLLDSMSGAKLKDGDHK